MTEMQRLKQGHLQAEAQTQHSVPRVLRGRLPKSHSNKRTLQGADLHGPWQQTEKWDGAQSNRQTPR